MEQFYGTGAPVNNTYMSMSKLNMHTKTNPYHTLQNCTETVQG